jgi:hypothetical protein
MFHVNLDNKDQELYAIGINSAQKCNAIYVYGYFNVINYSSVPVSTGNTFQDLPQLRETAYNTERYI